MLRASELFAEDGGEFHHEVLSSRKSNNHQLSGAASGGEADNAEVRFRGFHGDQGRKGALLVTMTDPSQRERGSVELCHGML